MIRDAENLNFEVMNDKHCTEIGDRRELAGQEAVPEHDDFREDEPDYTSEQIAERGDINSAHVTEEAA